MNYRTALFKIGGKIIEDFENLNSTISQLAQIYNEGLLERIIIIPGGGSFANFIRKIYSELKFTEEIAHWMGIISMNYNGLELNKKFPNVEIIENYERLIEKKKIFCIFLPYEYIKGNDKLPHSWDVTSDSISLFLAKELELNECYLIKDVDGILNNENQVIRAISASELTEMKKSGKLTQVGPSGNDLKEQTTPIDPYITTLINKYKISCILLNGSKNTERIINYFKSSEVEEKVFTKII